VVVGAGQCNDMQRTRKTMQIRGDAPSLSFSGTRGPEQHILSSQNPNLVVWVSPILLTNHKSWLVRERDRVRGVAQLRPPGGGPDV
jgi:hypothetical protein